MDATLHPSQKDKHLPLFAFIRVYSRFAFDLALFFLIQSKPLSEPRIPQGTLAAASGIHLVDANTRK